MTKNVKGAKAVNEITSEPRPDEKYVLQLYITGATPNSIRAISNIKAICSKHLLGNFELQITDVYLHREIVAREQIVALPMLVKHQPFPRRKLIGDMSNTRKVLDALGIKQEPS